MLPVLALTNVPQVNTSIVRGWHTRRYENSTPSAEKPVSYHHCSVLLCCNHACQVYVVPGNISIAQVDCDLLCRCCCCKNVSLQVLCCHRVLKGRLAILVARFLQGSQSKGHDACTEYNRVQSDRRENTSITAAQEDPSLLQRGFPRPGSICLSKARLRSTAVHRCLKIAPDAHPPPKLDRRETSPLSLPCARALTTAAKSSQPPVHPAIRKVFWAAAGLAWFVWVLAVSAAGDKHWGELPTGEEWGVGTEMAEEACAEPGGEIQSFCNTRERLRCWPGGEPIKDSSLSFWGGDIFISFQQFPNTSPLSVSKEVYVSS